jgi:hypothetical protein
VEVMHLLYEFRLCLVLPFYTYAKTDCSNEPFNSSEWAFNSQEHKKRLLSESANKLSSFSEHSIQDNFIDSYSGNIEPLYKKDELGNLLRGTDGRKISNMHIDHVIPRKFMHLSGGCYWSPEKKMAFSNDPNNLRITTAHKNTSKGAHSPKGWMPKDAESQLRYLKQWREAAKKYSTISSYNTLYGSVALKTIKHSNPELFTQVVNFLKNGKKITIRIGFAGLALWGLMEATELIAISSDSYVLFNDQDNENNDITFDIQYESLQDYLDNRI